MKPAMSNAKYICFMDDFAGEIVIIFPSHVPHDKMASKLCDNSAIISAGFIAMRDDEVIPYGDSVSLGKKARIAEDKYLLNYMFRREK